MFYKKRIAYLEQELEFTKRNLEDQKERTWRLMGELSRLMDFLEIDEIKQSPTRLRYRKKDAAV